MGLCLSVCLPVSECNFLYVHLCVVLCVFQGVTSCVFFCVWVCAVCPGRARVACSGLTGMCSNCSMSGSVWCSPVCLSVLISLSLGVYFSVPD